MNPLKGVEIRIHLDVSTGVIVVIVTVTLNPAIDRTIWVDRLDPGALHRVQKSRSDVGGKGINVSRALRLWGARTRVVAVVGGEAGKTIRRSLESEGLPGDFITIPGESRINTKVIEAHAGRLTELNEAGPHLDPDVPSQVAEAVARTLSSADWLVLSGSLPAGAPPETYRTLMESAREQRPGLPIALDASGDALRAGISAAPGLIKPNRVEMEELLGRSLPGLNEWKEAVQEVRAMGVLRVVLSLGAEGALLGGSEGCYWAKASPIEVANPTGCGDTLLAATLFGLMHGWPWERCARFAVAAATAAATLPGTLFPSLEQIREVAPAVAVTPV